MLIRFIVENFASINDRAEFSMAASKVSRHPGHVNEILGRRVLRSSFLFGANAGGKTSFFNAMNFAVDVVQKGLRHVECSNRAFRLSEKPKDEGVFQFDFIANGHIYSYGFTVSYRAVSIVSEWLFLCDDPKNEVCLFNRDVKKDATIIETDLAKLDFDMQWWNFYKKDFERGDNSQMLVVEDLSRRNAHGNKLVEHILIVKKFFRRFVFISPDEVYGQGIYLQGDTNSQSKLDEYLRHFDTGITKVVLKELDYDEVMRSLPLPIRDQLQHDFKCVVENIRQKKARVTATVSNNKVTHFFDSKDGKIRVRQLLFEHGKKDVLFERSEESDGTRRLFDLLPLLLLLNSGSIVVIDEIDRSLHTKATSEFVRNFFDQSSASGSQLIATTHDGGLLDLDFLRQDEIWFVERDDDHATHIYPLTKFSVRFDSRVRKDYLLGRYGSLPIFGRLGEVEK